MVRLPSRRYAASEHLPQGRLSAQTWLRLSLAVVVGATLYVIWALLFSKASVKLTGTKKVDREQLERDRVPWYDMGELGSGIRDVLNETLGFHKIFVVNLEDGSSKLSIMKSTSKLSDFTLLPEKGIRGRSKVKVGITETAGEKSNKATIAKIETWRAHLNAVRRILTQSLGTALILEDDIDWDIALKHQLVDIARGTRFLASHTLSPFTAFSSPYGDNWDVLWLGHCGGTFQPSSPQRFVLLNDPTVPLAAHIATDHGTPPRDEWAANGTRIMYRAAGGSCQMAYAVSAAGARRIVQEVSVERFGEGWEGALGRLCEEREAQGLGGLNCYQVWPSLFGRWRTVGMADKRDGGIGMVVDGGGDVRREGHAHNVAYSVRLNLARMGRGEEGVVSQFTDMPALEGPIERVYWDPS